MTAKPLTQHDIELLAGAIDAIEDAAYIMRRHSGEIMTAVQATDLLKIHVIQRNPFQERAYSNRDPNIEAALHGNTPPQEGSAPGGETDTETP